MRLLRLFGAALIALLAVVPAVAGPAAAATTTPTGAWITCDATTGTITAGFHGTNLGKGSTLNASFYISNGLAVTATTMASPPQVGQTTTVTGTVGSDYTLDLIGYTRAWDPTPDLSYFETVSVTLKTTAGTVVSSPTSATCYYDTRDTFALTCGGDGKVFSLSVTGTQATAGSTDPYRYPYRVRYSQMTGERALGSAFTTYTLQPVVTLTKITRTGDTWTETGISRDLSGDAYFTDQIGITILDSNGWTISGASLACDYTAPAA